MIDWIDIQTLLPRKPTQYLCYNENENWMKILDVWSKVPGFFEGELEYFPTHWAEINLPESEKKK